MLLVYSEDFKLHDTPDGSWHPERPERLDIALEGLKRSGLHGDLKRVEPPQGDVGVYRKVHTPEYIEEVERAARTGLWLDPDTYASPGTLKALQRLAGAVELIVEKALGGEDILLLPRPPGHHAGISGAALGAPTLGFCLLNTAALTAAILAEEGRRVAVLDFDAHHGNGTQEIVWRRIPDVYHVDLHQDYRTLYPGTGSPRLRGSGNLSNINLPPGSGDDIYSEAIDLAFKIIEENPPDTLIVSAGFDAYKDDNPFTSLHATTNTFYTIGERITRLDVNTVIILEGGYSEGLKNGLPALIAALNKKTNPNPETPTQSPRYTLKRWEETYKETREAFSTTTR